MRLTPGLLAQATGSTPERAELFAGPLSVACEHYQINTVRRMAAFLAQIGHESGSLRHTVEVWGPTPAQHRYEGRRDLGNTQPGDGSRYRGRGLIQLTGRFNHAAVRDRLRSRGVACPDFETEPERLQDPLWAAWSAADFWDWKRLNPVADSGDFTRVTQIINGGQNGAADRERRHAIALRVLEQAQGGVVSAMPEPPPVPNKEPDMPLPLLKALTVPLATTLVEAFTPIAKEKLTKEIGRHTDSPQLAEHVANGVIEAAKIATGMSDPVAAVAAAKADPETLQRVESAAMLNVEQLLPALERINELEQANIRSAREFNAAQPLFVNTPWFKMQFVQALSLAFMAFSGWFVIEHWGSLTSELRGAVITLMVIAGWNGVRDYWMGSSHGSNEKNAMLARGSQTK